MRIKRFNESLESYVIDFDYIRNCFIEIIDNFHVKIYNDIDDDGSKIRNTCNISIQFLKPNSMYSSYFSIEELTKHFNKVLEMVNDIEASIDKVKIKYTNLRSKISLDPNKIDIEFNEN